MLLLQTQGGETVGLLGATEGARFGHTHPILSSPSPLAPWDTDFPARLSGTYSFREEWPHWHPSFILSRWHQSQTKGLRALEREKLGVGWVGGGVGKAQQIAVWLRIHSQKWCSSPSPSHGLQSDFLSCVICSSHSTRKQVSLLPSYWEERRDRGNSMDLGESREEQREGPSPGLPAHCTATTMSPGTREGDCPMVGWDGTSQHTHHLGLSRSD